MKIEELTEEEQRSLAFAALRPLIHWRCNECHMTGSDRLSASYKALSLFSRVSYRHSYLSPNCPGESLVVAVPTESLPTATELREREREFEEKYIERQQQLAAKRAASAVAEKVGKKEKT